MNYNDLLPQFKKHILIGKGAKSKTYKAILSSLNLLSNYSKTEKLKDFTESCVRTFLFTCSEERIWSPKTFRNNWQCLKTFFDWCVKSGYLKTNPVINIERPKLPKYLPRSISREDIKKVLMETAWYQWPIELEKTRNMAIISTLLYTGIRLQELLNLKVTDVNIDDGSIMVRQGKGGKDRLVPIHPILVPILRSYFEQRQKKLKPSEWFYTGIRSDKQLHQKDIRRICEIISKKAGVKFTPHMLRHTFGKLAVEADLPIYKLKEIMGHEQVTTTQRYVSIASESIKRSFEKIQLL